MFSATLADLDGLQKERFVYYYNGAVISASAKLLHMYVFYDMCIVYGQYVQLISAILFI